MLKSIQQRDLDRNRWIKITMAVILGLICISMVVTLIPGLMTGTTDATSPDAIATVAGQNISVAEFQQEFEQATRNQVIPQMRQAYVQTVLDQMIFQRALDYEANRLGISVTPQEESDRIKEIFPDVWSGDTWLKDRYPAEVQARMGMDVQTFETLLRNEMLEEKFRELVTDGITVTPAEVQQEFRWRNEKIEIDYALIKPAGLAGSIHPTDAQLAAWFAGNASRYQIPEKRSARYALLDLSKLRANAKIGDDALRAYYNAHIDDYKVETRAHVEHILFKTVGKTDAEIAEIHQKAEDVLKQAKHGTNFEDLAKKYSEDDATKAKGGDLGWIVGGQTVPEFQQAAFTVPKGEISDLVKTQYGFHIIKVLDREMAHTKTFEEVRDSILQMQLDEKVTEDANNISDQMAAAVRQSDRQSLDDLAKKFQLQVGETAPATVTEPLLPLGNSPDLHETLFALHPGELSRPIQIDSGFVIIELKDILPAHQATLAEVHDRALTDYQREKSIEVARERATELSKQATSGLDFDKAANALDLPVKTSDSFARNGSVQDVGTAKQLITAFNMPVGHISQATKVGENWIVYKVVSHDMPNFADLPAQAKDIEQQLLQTKQSAAYEAFHTALIDRLKSEKKVTINNDAVTRITRAS